MSAPQLSAVAVGLFVIVAIALAFSRSGCSMAAPTVVVVDPVFADTTTTAPKKKAPKKKTSIKKQKTPSEPPQQRNYRDEVVN